MAKLITDTTTGVAEAVGNLFVAGDGYTGGIYALLAYRINYDGANWVVSTSHGSTASAADVAVAWNAGDNRLDIDLSGLDNVFVGSPAIAFATLAASTHASGPNYDVQYRVVDAENVYARFRDSATSLSAYATSESTKMAFFIFLYGRIE